MADVYMQKIKRKKSFYRRLAENTAVQRSSTIILPVLLGILIFVLWQNKALQAILRVDTFVLPVPTKINTLISENISEVMSNSIATIQVAGLGLLLGSLIGYLAAVAASFFPNMGKGGLFIVGAFASIPTAALAPTLNNWTRDVSTEASVRSFVSKTIVVTLIAAANMSLNAYRGLTELKPYAKDLMATYAAPRHTVFFKLQLPNSVQYIFTALRVSVPSSIMTAIVSEYFAENIIGVGRQIRENIVLAQYSVAWVYITAACVIGIASYCLLMIVQTLVMKRYH